MELAGIGVTASVELYRATGKRIYADKAIELARTIVESQQKPYVGKEFPLAGFFYSGPGSRHDLPPIPSRKRPGADRRAVAARSRRFPNHADWMKWYSTVALYSEYQKTTRGDNGAVRRAAGVRLSPGDDVKEVPDSARCTTRRVTHIARRCWPAMPMGDGWYLRAFPVWFARRGNYGVLLSQAKALSAASRLRGDRAGLDLAQRQAEWIVGRNPFAQSTMYGEGYDWSQQYSVSSGDFVGSLPVGMQSRGDTDLPYWPSQNMYVYKEVWVHPTSRWLWMMEDLLRGPAERPSLDFNVSQTSAGNGDVTLRVIVRGEGTHSLVLRAENLTAADPVRSVTLRAGTPTTLEWKARRTSATTPWVGVVVADGDASQRRDVVGR